MKDYLRKIMEKAVQTAGLLLPVFPVIFLVILLFMVAAGRQKAELSAESVVKAADVDWNSLNLQRAIHEEAVEDPSPKTFDEQKASREGALTIADGTYQGSAQGYGGLITVDVKVAGGTILSIDIVSAPGETESYFTKAKGVIDSMISNQSTKVDAVSGATFSSSGIIAAVENALYGKKDQVSSTASKEASNNSSNSTAPSVSTVKETASYKDGVYTVAARRRQ